MNVRPSGQPSRQRVAAERVAREFDLGPPLRVEPLAGGSAEVLRLTTGRGDFVVKPVRRAFELELYATVEQSLNASGVRQARLVRTSTGAAVSTSGHSVQEFLPGAILDRPTERQSNAAMRHLAAYTLALATVAVPTELDRVDNVWTRVTSPSYLIDRLPELMVRYGPAGVGTGPVRDGLQLLGEIAPALAGLPRRLVHGDLAPDNVLVRGEEVVAVIDFTPHHESELFSLATALYWYHLNPGPGHPRRIRSDLAAYAEHRPLSGAEHALLGAALVREALRRLATPLAYEEASGVPARPAAVRRRYGGLLAAIDLYGAPVGLRW